MQKINLTKSKFVNYMQCEKMLYLDIYKPQEKQIDESQEEIFRVGNEVGDLAMGLFGDFVEVTSYIDGKLDLNKMVEKTYEEISKKTSVICEASFTYNNLYCAVDILRLNEDGYDIYEVKSSSHVKDVHVIDVSFQRYVLEKCNVNVKNCYVVTIDSSYIRKSKLDISKLFKITDVTDKAIENSDLVSNAINNALSKLKEEEPKTTLTKKCKSPYLCPYFKYCHPNIPEYSVFDLYLVKNAFDYVEKGILSFDDLLEKCDMKSFTKMQQLQLQMYSQDYTYVDKKRLKEFLSQIKYPIYYLDFESMNLAIPPFENTKPFGQIPFQYSLHIKQSPTSEVIHKEFLGYYLDSRYSLAKSLVENIKDDGTIIAYNKSFEETRIKELALLFPEFKNHLLAINKNFIDLIVPFRSGMVYNKKMKGSFSIKSVLPSLFENDKDLDYKNLDVHNGKEAKDLFPKMMEMNDEELNKSREALLKYCNLDTLAMVKIHEKLIELLDK